MNEFVATGRIEQGIVKMRNVKMMTEALKHWRDGEIIITISRAHATRSLAQNAFWWGVVVKTFAEHCGNPPHEMHEILKAELLPEVKALLDKDGNIIGEHTLGRPTHKLNKVEFGELIKAAQELGARMGLNIPDPNEDCEAA